MKPAITLILSVSTSIALGSRVDTVTTPNGKPVAIHFIGHGSLMFEYNNETIYIDPWSQVANYENYPKADFIFITHHHADHLDSLALSKIYTKNTKLFWTSLCEENSNFKQPATVLKNDDKLNVSTFSVEVIPAYNIVNKRASGEPFHVKGDGNGYIFNFDGLKIYVAGDTENIPEMSELGRIDIAFLPMNLPYTMTPKMVSEAALIIKPKILYPYHYGETNTNELKELLNNHPEIEIRL